MEATNYTAPVCLSGWSHWLGCWQESLRMTPLGQDIWQVCVVFPRGAERIQEYLYLKDDCSTFESIPSRFVALDESLGEQLVADIWDNGPGGCAVVPTEKNSFGGLKALFDR